MRASCDCARPECPRWELAQVFARHGQAFIDKFNPAPWLRKVMRSIVSCRTRRLGGHLEKCPDCGYEREVYHSCNDRHCPKCGGVAKARWLQARRAELLPVPYFHVVITLPHELNRLLRANLRVGARLFFQAASTTLLEFALTRWQGRLGVLAVLHTWNQRLLQHFHLHCLIPAGALALDHSRWVPIRNHYLFPIKALRSSFRARFLRLLERACRRQELVFPEDLAPLATPSGFRAWRAGLLEKKWDLCIKCVDRSERLFDYLARYTHRTAIGNHRILAVDHQNVTFTYRDRQQGNVLRTLTLAAEEFIHRFLLHVLPTGVVRIRYFGFLANRHRRQSLAQIRELIGTSAPSAQPVGTARQLMIDLTGRDPLQCPACGAGVMQFEAPVPAWPALQPLFVVTYNDS